MSWLRFLFGTLTIAGLAVADGNLDALNNRQGQTPCCVTQQLLAPCQGSSLQNCSNPVSDSNVNPGSICTCNTVVFNLWSACLYIGNETLPLFNNWTSSCQANATSVTYNDYPLQVYAGEVDIPPWAFISPRGNFSFDLSEALEQSETKGKGWSTVQIVLPIIIGVSLLATVAALFFCYRRRTLHRYERGNTTDSPRSRPFHRPFALKSSIQQVHSNTGDAHGKSWVIDNFESPMDRTSFDWEDGHVWLTPSPISPQTHVAHGFQHYVTQLWRNPFKRKVVKVESLPPRQGFRVDDADLSTLASNPGHPAGDGGRGHRNGMVKNDSDGWSMVEAEEVFDARDDGLDERSVLLISQSPGVDFSLESIRSPTPPADVSVIRPSQDSNPPISPQSSRRIVTPTSPYSVVYPRKQPADTIPPAQTSPTSPQSTGHLTTTSRNPLRYRHDPSTETLIRPPRTDPVMLFPPSVRAAGYNGVTNPYSSHSRDVSSDSQLASAVPMTHVSMP